MALSYIPKDVSDFITVDKLIESLTRLRDKYNCGNLPVALSHWEDYDLAEIHQSGLVRCVGSYDGPHCLHVGSDTLDCIMLDFELFPKTSY